MRRCPCPLPVPPHALALAGALLFAALPVGAAVFKPTPGRDVPVGACDTDCSLREAVVAANANPGVDVILLAPGHYDLSIVGAGEEGGDLDVTGELLLLGNGASAP
jgi:CSLREA domain-containing protein